MQQVVIQQDHLYAADWFFSWLQTFGPVVKLEFTPPCQGGGRGFESRRDRWGVLALFKVG